VARLAHQLAIESPLVAADSPVQTGQVSFACGFSAVAAKDLPAVANIASTKIVRTPEGGQMSPFFSDPFSRQFFGDQFSPQHQHPIFNAVLSLSVMYSSA
jgi:S1-C subfamily serine protease